MSTRHQRTYRKRGKDEHVICVNCNVRLKLDDGKGGYRKRFPLTNRLQDRKWDPSRKPGISILEGLVETIPDLAAGNISQILSALCLCHGCFILLRQVVNFKFKVQNLLVELQQKIGGITNEMRLQTNKQAEKDDKVTKCWVCQEKFTNKATKFAMHRHVLDELTVREAIETLLPEESATLQGVSKKYLLICKNCFKILNKIITSQCQAETTRQSFIETTSEDGLISKIQEQGDDFDILDDDDNDYEEEGNEKTENVDQIASETVLSEDMTVAETGLSTEVQASENYEGETEAQSVILVLTGSSVEGGEKRKLQQTCSQIEEDTSEFISAGMCDGLEDLEEKNSKRRKPDVDVLSILQSTNSQNEEALSEFSDDIFETELDEGKLIVDEDKTEHLSENVLKKVVYYLQQNLFRQAFNTLKRNSTVFEEEFQKMVINYIKKETTECDNLENTDWTKLSSLHSGTMTLESFIELFRENLPMLSAILSYSISGQRHVDFTKIEKATIQRLLTVMGVIAFERNPNCHLLQSLNSIQMAEDGCTRELYNTFYGLGLCLKEKDTQKLLTTPDYSTHQVCWHLLKEAQEIRGSKAAKQDNTKVLKEEADKISDTDDEDNDSLPEDFADVCPYWKLPKSTPSEIDTSSEEWVLYYDPKAAGRAELIRLIFEEAGVPYRQCEEPYERKEIIGRKMAEYPTFSPPVVRKGKLKLTQLPVICRHLGELFGLCPNSADDRIQAEQICHTCHDYLVEVRITLHGIDDVENPQTDKEATEQPETVATEPLETSKPHIDRFTKNRIPRFLSFFETALKANSGGKGFFFGDKLTYADLAVLHILSVTENHFPEVFKQMTDIPQLKRFRDSICSRPRLKAYFESDRCIQSFR